jgi:hypothetical protein
MILRVVHGRIPGGKLETVRAALEVDYVPRARACAGLDRYLVAIRPADEGRGDEGHELALMTVWLDVASALAAFDGDLTAVRAIDNIDHGEILERVEYYEVEIGATRRTAGVPARLRLTAGQVGKGLDAEIQHQLRGRLDDLEPEVVDAYIGRRVLGSRVEIAFVSTWSATQSGRRLEEPVWPDISAQYETFEIRVFDVLLEGRSDR